jgi:Fur family peroxide stress response transcriptional regulator
MTITIRNISRPQRARRGLRPAEIGDTGAWSERFERLCRDRGIRVTPQRIAVYGLLAGDKTHPTAEAVYERLRRRMASLSLATVYRVLECLEREGLVHRVSAFDGAARYEAKLNQHHHFVCRLCDSIIDSDERIMEEFSLPRRAPAGFVPDELEMRILGICSTCRRAGRSGRTADVKQPRTRRRGDSWQHSKAQRPTKT